MIKKIIRKLQKKRPHTAAVIVAAGSASRMQGVDKILAPLGGEPLLSHTVSAFQMCQAIDEIVIVTREDLVHAVSRMCYQRNYDKVTTVVPGGATRPRSVMIGMDHVANKTGIVAIHDGARPFVTSQIIEETVQKTLTFHAVAPAVPVKDTIKAAQNRMVTDTPDRSSLYAIQTPQTFDYDLLRGALQKALDEELPITDDCSAVEAMGMSVYLSHGLDENIKITTPTDLILAEAILKSRRKI